MSSNIPENVLEMSKTIQKNAKLSEHGVIEIDETCFEQTLAGTPVAMDDIKKVNDHRDLFVAALAHTTGEMGLQAMKKNKDLEQVSAEVKMYKDNLGAVLNRTRQVPDGNKGMKTSYGSLTPRVIANGSANKGALKKVKQHISEEAARILAG